jgi:hypothetical protein
MKTSDITIENFKKYIARVKCITMLHYRDINDMKLKEVGRARKTELEAPEEIGGIRGDKLVWYMNDSGERVYWNERMARNITVEEQAAHYGNAGLEDKIKSLLESLRQGLDMDIEIISVYDTILREKVIVDGVCRAVALYYLFLNEKEALGKLFKSRHRIYLIDLVSPAGALLFPYDFLNICRDYGR